MDLELQGRKIIIKIIIITIYIYIYIYKSLFKDAKLKGLEFHAYALISFKTSMKLESFEFCIFK